MLHSHASNLYTLSRTRITYNIYIYIHLYRGHNDVVWSLTADRYKVFSSGSDSTIKIWDMENLAKGCIRTLEGHTGTVSITRFIIHTCTKVKYHLMIYYTHLHKS